MPTSVSPATPVSDSGPLLVRFSARLRIHPCTLKRHAREGVLKAQRVNDKGEILFAPFDGQPPEPQQGKPLCDRRRYPKLATHVRKEVQYEA